MDYLRIASVPAVDFIPSRTVYCGGMKTFSAINILLQQSELKVRRARLFSYRRPYRLAWRTRPDYDLVLIGKGRGFFEIEGLGRQHVRPGTVMLFSPKIAHGTAEEISGGYQEVSIHFDLTIGSGTDFFEAVSFLPIVHLRNWEPLYAMARRASHECRQDQGLGSALLVHDLTRTLLVEMIRRYARGGAARVACDPRVLKVLHRLETDFAKPLSAEQIAEGVGLSEGHMRMLFKKELGITAMDALVARRIREARKLLEATALSIAKISRGVGYDDPLYFSRAFHRMVGLAPSQYRESANRP